MLSTIALLRKLGYAVKGRAVSAYINFIINFSEGEKPHMTTPLDSNLLWARFKKWYVQDARSGFAIDISRMLFAPEFMESTAAALMRRAQPAMQALVQGAIANPSEKRMVGHYWLRNPELAPDAQIRRQIEDTHKNIKDFARKVHAGEVRSPQGSKFSHVLVIGIGGSALGPRFVSDALGSAKDALEVSFFDNTDPDGMNRVLDGIPSLESCLCVVISKSGGTKETRNGQLVAKQAWKAKGLDFARYAVAITGAGSELERTAVTEQWLARFPMWDWVGGRTSEMSAVGLLPAALQGIAIDDMLRGARDMDQLTSAAAFEKNPAALLALMWHHAGGGKGLKDMVVLPYKDRLELFSKYLQQLVMESLGKEKDADGRIVNQGIAVYGNKGSTDQHAYVQQLRDGVNNFFVVFINVLKAGSAFSAAREGVDLEVEPGVYSGDYLSGFLQGTRRALYESGRESVTITIPEVSAYHVGMLIALFERAVGYYAFFVNINAYDQPGVEAGKKAAAQVLKLQADALKRLTQAKTPLSVEELAAVLGRKGEEIQLFYLLEHLAANGRVKVQRTAEVGGERYRV